MRLCPRILLGFILFDLLSSTLAVSCSSNKFGRDCGFTCHCKHGVSCDVTTGRCPRGCAAGWDGGSCQRENVAYNRETRQKDGKDPINTSDMAVDDDVETCSETKPAVPGWWTVTLENTTVITTVKLLADKRSDINGWKVYAGLQDKIFSMTLCATVRFHGDGAFLKCDMPIIAKHVMVVNRGGPVTLCDVGIYACSRYWFGTECDKACNCADQMEICDVDTGACSSGCQPGWTGNDCQTGCRKHYGNDCKFPCGKCDNNMDCDKISGACPLGCKGGWKGVYCTEECDSKTFGKNCAKVCDHCNGDGSCDSVTGRCNYGCIAGFTGDKCDKTCSKGMYGENCNFECTNCAEDMACDTQTGVCLNGCKHGWEGAFCTQECLTGYYGKSCQGACDNCLNGDCDKVTGHCLAGCAAGYTGKHCAQVCESGWFGMNCSQSCGKCMEGPGHLCNVINGTCIHGCQFAYNMPFCNELCPSGYYGQGCEKCGMCKPPATCDVYTGKCPDGCGLDFYGDKCLMSDPFSDKDGPQLAIFLGFMVTIVGLMMIIVTVCLVIVWQREELADISRKPGHKNSVHEISVREENGFLMAEDEEEVDYV